MGWLDGWRYRKKHYITSPAGTVNNYSVKIVVHYGSGTDDLENCYLEGKCKSDFGDVRFTASDGETLLPYEYESEGKVDGDHATYIVKLNEIKDDGSTYIYVYYGNPSAVYDGDPKQVSVVYEDMETAPEGTLADDAIYDSTNKWVRLTRAVGGIKGFLYYDRLPQYGFYARFKIWAGGGNGADATWLGVYDSDYAGTTEDIVKGGYHFTADEYQDRIAFTKSTSDNGTPIASASQSGIDNGNWHTYEVYFWISDGKAYCKIYWDGTLKVDASDSSPQSNALNKIGKLIFGARTGGSYNEHRIDDIVVREYISPEPTHGAWEAEETAPPPTVSTQDASDITTDSATLNGSVDAINDDEIVERGFEWGTESGNYTDSWTETGSFGVGSFSHQITNLSPNTTYYYRAKAKNSLGEWGYGPEVSFTTEAPPPTVSTQAASNVTFKSATLNGSVDAINDTEIVERGFEWGTSPGVYDNEWTETGSFGAGAFSHDLSGLNPETTYYYRAKAKNSYGEWGYGEEQSFTTSSVPPPDVSTSPATDVDISSATLHGSVTAINDTRIVERGFEWGTSPGVYDSEWTESGSFGTEAFSHILTNLSQNTTYYYRAKAKNEYGVWGYGEERSFTTLGGPTVITKQPETHPHAVVLKGEITEINDTEVVERGFEWGTESGSYTDSWIETGSFGVGEFSKAVSGLKPGSRYYYRAKAKNSDGIWGYGEEVVFETDPALFIEGFNIKDFSFTKTLREYANHIVVKGFISQPGDQDSWTESLDGWEIYDGSSWQDAETGGAILSTERQYGSYSLKFPASAQKMRYPSTLDLGLNGAYYSGIRCYLGNESGEDIQATIRLCEDENNYLEVVETVRKTSEAGSVEWTEVDYLLPEDTEITAKRKCETDPLDSSNLLSDPSFETWPTNWTISGDITQDNITKTGSYSVKTNSLGSISQIIEDVPEIIWAGCWRQGGSQVNEDYLIVKVEWLNDSGEVVDTAESTAAGPFPASWEECGPYMFVRPATATKAKIIFTLYSSDGNAKRIDAAFVFTFPTINYIEISKDKNQPLYMDKLHVCNWRQLTAENASEIVIYGKRTYSEEKDPAGTYEELQAYVNDLLTEKTAMDYELEIVTYIPNDVWIWYGDIVKVKIPSFGIDSTYMVEEAEYDFVNNQLTLRLGKLLTRLSGLLGG